MSFITVKAGAPEIPPNFVPGAYILVLADVKDPKTVVAQRGPKAGQEIDLIDWQFQIFDGPFAGLNVEASTSTASGPKSKMFSWLTALFGGRAPAIGQQIEKADLVGKLCLGTLVLDESGYLRLENLSAVPASMLAQGVAAATGVPVTAPGAPAPSAVAQAPAPAVMAAPGAQAPLPAGDLPF